MARSETDLAARLRMLIAAEDTAGEFLRRALASNLGYAARIGPEIAVGVADVDAAMRLGFGWELGPFQTLDALGDAAARLLPEVQLPIPAYHNGSAWSFVARSMRPLEALGGAVDPPRVAGRTCRATRRPRSSSSSTGSWGWSSTAKLNIIGLDTIAMIERAVALAAERYDGLVIGTAAPDFSAGANLALMLIEAEEGEWDELDRVIRRFQGAMQAIRHAPVPVVAAPRGRTLGGGAELVLAAFRAQPLAETYIGLVELGVGLIPAGGGSTAMARRIAERCPTEPGGPLPPLQPRLHWQWRRPRWRPVRGRPASTSTSPTPTRSPPTPTASGRTPRAPLAGSLTPATGRRASGRIAVLGRRGIAAAEALSYNQLVGRHISEHDRTLVLELARVMSGGDVAEGTLVSERHLLDLEREAFLRLLGERLTRDRIRHTLKTGKPLRN